MKIHEMKAVIISMCSMQLNSRLLVDEEMLELIEGKYLTITF